MEIHELIKIANDDIQLMLDKIKITEDYLSKVSLFIKKVEYIYSDSDWIVGKLLEDNFRGIKGIYQKPKGNYSWKIIGEKNAEIYNRDSIFNNKFDCEILIDFNCIEKATIAKQQNLCRIKILRGKLTSSFDFIVRNKSFELHQRAFHYNNFLEKIKKNIVYGKKGGKNNLINVNIDIHEYKTMVNQLLTIENFLNDYESQKNDFVFIYRGDEYDANQENFKAFFEKLLDNVYCLK